MRASCFLFFFVKQIYPRYIFVFFWGGWRKAYKCWAYKYLRSYSVARCRFVVALLALFG